MSYEFRIGLLAAVVIVITVWGYTFMKGKNLLVPTNTYYVNYSNVNDLTAMLSSGDVTVTTGNGAVTIGIVSPFAWASTHRLTLNAFQGFVFPYVTFINWPIYRGL